MAWTEERACFEPSARPGTFQAKERILPKTCPWKFSEQFSSRFSLEVIPPVEIYGWQSAGE